MRRSRARRTDDYDLDDPEVELEGLRAAWLADASLSDVSVWLHAVFPGALGRAEAASWLTLDAHLQQGGVRVRLSGHDGGFLHALTVTAMDAGCSGALVIEGDDRSGSGWRAFTFHQPGAKPQTVLHDPVRGQLLTPATTPEWLLSQARRFGLEEASLQMIEPPPWSQGPSRLWTLRDAGQTLKAPRPSPHQARALPAWVDTVVEWVKLVLVLAFLGPVFLAVPIFVYQAFAASLGMSWAAALGAAATCALGGALLGALPLSLPTGRRVPRRVAMPALTLAQFLVPLLWHWRVT
jgi:hypothetical protein